MNLLIASELAIHLILVLWIITATIKGLKKVAPVPEIKHLDLMKGIWKLEIALGLALCGLAALGIIAAINFPLSFGIVMLLMTLSVFILTHQATKDLEKVPTVASYVNKIDKWFEERKKK